MTQPVAAWRATYTPGNWLALSGPSTLVVLTPPPPAASKLVNDLWRSIVTAGAPDALLALLAGAGLDAMPDLGAFFWDDEGLHGLARGRVRVVDTDTGDVALEGEGSITWREEHLGRERHLGITLEALEEDDALQLPLVVGAAGVSAIYLTTDPSDLVRFPSNEPRRPRFAASEPSPIDAAPPASEPTAGTVMADPAELFADEPAAPATDHDAVTHDPASALGGVVAAPPVAPEIAVPPPPLAEPGSLSSPSPDPSIVIVPPQLGEVEEDDGGTIFSTGLAATHKPAPSSGERADAQVLAVPCLNGHANAPGSRTCRICQAPVDAANPRLIRRPVLAGVHTNRGDFADIVAGVVIGRSPDAGKGPNGSYLMRVQSPSNDISRSHVLITTREWNVQVTDLHSTNGTTILPVGEPPFTLRDGASVTVELGTVLDLGDGVSVRIEPPRG